jgi:Cdc6-like AAA superfamily ATPase
MTTVRGAKPQTAENWRYLLYDVIESFSPGAPIDDLNLLAGRLQQISDMIDAVIQRGHHAILYGERGVGKSSLANTFSVRLITPTRAGSTIPVQCDPSDDFSAIWRKVFRRLSGVTHDGVTETLDRGYQGTIYPDDVLIELEKFNLNTLPIIILDEFDKVRDEDAKTLTANTIKGLSDRSVRATVIVVGVADSVSDLLRGHESIGRCLRQIPMPRMSGGELRQIINDRLPRHGMSIAPDVLDHIVSLSRGLPYYTHLFGQQASAKAIEAHSLEITMEYLDAALPACVSKTGETLGEQYHQATSSPRKDHIYKEVLLAAALAKIDDRGYFAPVDLERPLTALLGRQAKVSLFGQHLKNLKEDDRGAVLEQIGSDRRYRYRFAEPMMQSFILLDGLQKGLITRKQVKELAATRPEPSASNVTGQLF